MLTITNDGPKILSTNFWNTPYNDAGYFYVSINAGCIRVLVPHQKVAEHVPEMKTAEFVIFRKTGDRIYLTFVDGSDAPYRLDLSFQQCGRLPSPDDYGRDDATCTVWVHGPQKVFSCPARLR